MQRERTGQLRLFCICGQKMRVSDDMYGRPGKCIACRQKIRIPRRDEVPKGVTEIFLKDHPEFLRKSSPRKVKLPKVADDGSQTPVPISPEDDETLSTVPLDVLEPLRVVVSITYKIEQRLAAMRKGGSLESEADRAEWQGYLARITGAREDLEDQLRQRLMEVAIELASTQEKIAEAGLSVRVGEMDYARFRETTEKLRHRRDRLERRQANLRGWLNTHDPYVAGGYVDVSVDQIPGRGIRLTLPNEVEAPGSPLQIYLEDLRQAFEMFERADRKLAETARLEKEGNIPAQGLAHARNENVGVKKRATAAIEFAKGRLQQLLTDYDSDLKSISAQMDLARGRLQVGEIDRAAFDRIEKDLLRTRADIAKAKAIVRRAIAADGSKKVPNAAGTFMQRLGPAKQGDDIPADAWIAWAAALALLVTIVLPALSSLTPLAIYRQQSGPMSMWFVILPSATAILAILLAFVPNAVVRGFLTTFVWAVTTLCTVYLFKEMSAGPPFAQLVRDFSFLEPGIVTFLLGMALLAISAAVAVAPFRRARWAFVLVAILVVGAGALIGNSGQPGIAAPTLDVRSSVAEDSAAPAYRTVVNVTNNDEMDLVINRNAAARGEVDVLLERKIGSESWQPLEESAVLAEGGTATFQQQQIPSNGSATLTFTLAPGDYRLSVAGPGLNDTVQREFMLAAIAETPSPVDPTEMTPGNPGSEAGAANGIGVYVELQGVIQNSDFPQFSMNVRTFDGTEHRRRLSLTDEVYGGWQIEEYDPTARAVTLRKEDEILIVPQGKTIELTG